MSTSQQESDGASRLAYILGVPLAESVVRQWPQMREVVRTSRLVAEVEGNFPELTLAVGRHGYSHDEPTHGQNTPMDGCRYNRVIRRVKYRHQRSWLTRSWRPCRR